MRKQKRASIADLAMVMIVIFTASIVFLTVKYSYTQFVDIATNHSIVNSSSAAVVALDQSKELTNRFDYIIFMLLMGFTLSIIIIGYFSGGHPLFAFVYFIALVILVAISAVFSFVWEKVSEKAIFTTTMLDFPIMDLILDNFPIYIAVVGFIGMLVMFARPTISQP